MYSQITSNKRRTIILMFVFSIIIVGIGYIYGMYTGYGWQSIIPAAGISLVMASFSYFQGDKVALWSSGAKPVAKEKNAYVYRMVENLCITNGQPIPAVYIIPDMAINAFATGRNPNHASIAITQGAIEKLKNEELEGVIAHELSHVKNYDIRIATVVIVLVGIVTLLADWAMRARFFGKARDDHDSNNQGNALIIIVGLALIILAPLFAQLIQLAISRKREYLADASGSLLTRYPEGLASALEKIKQENLALQNPNRATAHLYFANPFGRMGRVTANLFSTHPPIDDRIKKLRSMA